MGGGGGVPPSRQKAVIGVFEPFPNGKWHIVLILNAFSPRLQSEFPLDISFYILYILENFSRVFSKALHINLTLAFCFSNLSFLFFSTANPSFPKLLSCYSQVTHFASLSNQLIVTPPQLHSLLSLTATRLILIPWHIIICITHLLTLLNT